MLHEKNHTAADRSNKKLCSSLESEPKHKQTLGKSNFRRRQKSLLCFPAKYNIVDIDHSVWVLLLNQKAPLVAKCWSQITSIKQEDIEVEAESSNPSHFVWPGCFQMQHQAYNKISLHCSFCIAFHFLKFTFWSSHVHSLIWKTKSFIRFLWLMNIYLFCLRYKSKSFISVPWTLLEKSRTCINS